MLQSYYNASLLEAGCDEAGRGCLAGPVVAAAVIWPQDLCLPMLNDSKQLKESERYALRPQIEELAIAYAIGVVDTGEIDQINILQASFKAMHMALEALAVAPQHILVDGNRFNPFPFVPHTCIVKGDSKFASIAAASILAKTYRDDLMNKLHLEYEHYLWHQNKGYPTKAHRKAIAQWGITPYHRKSFRLLENTGT